jgi:acyl dehydratase
MLNPAATGVSAGPTSFEWDAELAMLYALGVGAGTRELEYTTDNSQGFPQKVLPTFAVLAGTGAFEPDGLLSKIGSFDLAMAVHGDQFIQVHSSIPTSGVVDTVDTVTGIYDKGRGAAIVIESRSTSATSDETLFTTTKTIFVRGAGGFGGGRGPSIESLAIEGHPHHTVTEQTTATQALLYRLTGDKNPLHSDPMFARRVGMQAPILHGLCTYGFVGRSLLRKVCAGDETQFGSMFARFVAPVFPGDTLTTSIWLNDAGATFEVRTQPDKVVLDRGVFCFR